MAAATMMKPALLSSTKTQALAKPCATFRPLVRPAVRRMVIPRIARGACGPQGSASASFRGRCGPWGSWNVHISDQDKEDMRRAWKECFGDAEAWTGSYSPGKASSRGGDWFVAVDAFEDEDTLYFVADVPGITKADLKVQINRADRILTISGERQKFRASGKDDAEAEPEWQSKRVERRSGKFERKFKLPEKADIEAFVARVQDGLLTVTVRKYQDGGPDVINVPVDES